MLRQTRDGYCVTMGADSWFDVDFKRQLGDAVDHIMGDLKSSRVVLLAKGSTAKSQKQGVVLIQPFNQLKANEAAAQAKTTGGRAKEAVHHSSLCSDLSQPPSFFSTTSGTQVSFVDLKTRRRNCACSSCLPDLPLLKGFGYHSALTLRGSKKTHLSSGDFFAVT